jgi:uncharacterized SAM-binding protein YcdF (DUF218 family)
MLFSNAGTWLVKSDPPVHADAMVMLMGGIPPDRLLQAANNYNKGLAGRLIIVEENRGRYSELEARGAHFISNTEQAAAAAPSLGIPAGSVTILPGDARSTQDEALIVRSYLQSNPAIDTITLITNSAHSRRAAIIFKSAFRKAGLPVIVFTSANNYSNFNGKGWWKHKETIEPVLSEYMKLLNFWLFDQKKL